MCTLPPRSRKQAVSQQQGTKGTHACTGEKHVTRTQGSNGRSQNTPLPPCSTPAAPGHWGHGGRQVAQEGEGAGRPRGAAREGTLSHQQPSQTRTRPLGGSNHLTAVESETPKEHLHVEFHLAVEKQTHSLRPGNPRPWALTQPSPMKATGSAHRACRAPRLLASW